LYVGIGVGRENPDVRAVVWKVLHAGGESDGSRSTPSNMIKAR
jgi:hypothetical protein